MIKKEPIAIAALIMTAVLGWVFCLCSEFALISIKNEYELLNTRFNSIYEDYIKLSEKYDDLNSTYEYIVINEHVMFENVYSSLISFCRERERDYNFLYYSYDSLKEDYDLIKEKYDELSLALMKGKSVAESFKWVSEDKCLKLNSELILLGTYCRTHTVKVTVKNIGDKQINKLCILLFPYKNGKFLEMPPEYVSTIAENIYIGEKYSYNFTNLSEEITSYKIIAVAG